MKPRALALLLTPAVIAGLSACSGSSGSSSSSSPGTASTTASASMVKASGFSVSAVQSAIEAQLTKQSGGVYEASIPRDDLHIKRGSVPIQPSFDQDTELDFLPQAAGQAVVMGELASTEAEQTKLVPALLAAGIQVTAVHNHITELSPVITWVHIMARGEATTIATKIRTVLQRTTHTQFPVKEGKKTTTLPTKALASTLGGQPMVEDGGIVTVSVDRGDQISMNGMSVPSEMGVDALVYFEPLGARKAATTGEMCLIGSEVEKVMAALAQHGLTVTALHNHMIDTTPMTYFVHWFGTGSPSTLAADVRAALDQANYPKKS